jgi:hypothetical protein
MEEKGLRAHANHYYEEVAPCPDCHRIEIEYWVGGKKFRVMDAADVRQSLRL